MRSSDRKWDRTSAIWTIGGAIIAIAALVASVVYATSGSTSSSSSGPDVSVAKTTQLASGEPVPASVASNFDAALVDIEGALGVANVTAGDERYSKSTTLKKDEVAKFQVYYNNKENDDSGLIADDLAVRIDWNSSGVGEVLAEAKISGANTNTIQSSVVVIVEPGLILEQIEGSAVWRHNIGSKDDPMIVDETIPDSVVGTGVVLGDVPSLYEFSGTVTVLARAVEG